MDAPCFKPHQSSCKCSAQHAPLLYPAQLQTGKNEEGRRGMEEEEGKLRMMIYVCSQLTKFNTP